LLKKHDRPVGPVVATGLTGPAQEQNASPSILASVALQPWSCQPALLSPVLIQLIKNLITFSNIKSKFHIFSPILMNQLQR